MASHNFVKAAAAAALTFNGGDVSNGVDRVGGTCMGAGPIALNEGGVVDTCQHELPQCPGKPFLPLFHHPHFCETRPSRPEKGHEGRALIYQKLKESGTGASLVPNQQTVTCPMGEVQSLENEMAVKGFDTTWIVENTSTKNAVVAWSIDEFEWSPFHPDLKAIDDPKAMIRPGEFISVPTFESFVYHVREIGDDGALGNIVLQHRVGMIPIGNPHNNIQCDAKSLDVEPYSPGLELEEPEFGREGVRERPCNTIDIGFRNQVGCPLSVYWANTLEEVPEQGFSCAEKYHFHMGTQASSQDFMWDWNSETKYEGSFIGHTFVARLASDPSVVIQKYTLETTKIIDCPTIKKQQVIAAVSNEETEEITAAQGISLPSAADEDIEGTLTAGESSVLSLLGATAGANGISG